MNIRLGSLYSRVVRRSSAEDHALYQALSVRVPNCERTYAFQEGRWDGMKRFYSRRTGKFLTGFLPFVVSLCEQQQFPLVVDDQRGMAAWPSRLCIPSFLRAYQAQAIRDILTHQLTVGADTFSWQRGTIHAPTGSGKSILAAALIGMFKARTLFLVQSKDLLHQTARMFKERGLPVGIYGDGQRQNAPVLVATVQTLVRSPRFRFDLVHMVIADECHHIAETGMLHDVLSQCTNTLWRFGMSGTPLSRGDVGDVTLIGHMGPVISTVDRKELEAEGYLARPKITMITVDTPRLHSLHYPSVYKHGIAQNATRNLHIVELAQEARRQQRPLLILVRLIDHGVLLQQALVAKGIRSRFLQGATDATERQDAMKRLGTSLDALVATAVMDEGVDVPSIEVLILAGGGASHIKSIQRVGRGLRPKTEGSNVVEVYDFYDKTHRYLESHSKSRYNSYIAEQFTTRIVESDDG